MIFFYCFPLFGSLNSFVQILMKLFFFLPCMCRNQDEDEEIHQARHHYLEAEVDGCTIYKLFDDAHVKVSLDQL